MPYTAGYIGRGFRGSYYGFDDPAAKRRRLDAAADLALSVDQPELAGFIEGVGSAVSGDQVVPEAILGSSVAPSSGMARVSRMRRGFRRRRRWKRRSFKSKVGSALLQFKETQRELDPVAEATFTAGDGTTRVLYIASPISQIGQGTSGDDFQGDRLWIKACWLRGRIAIGQTTNTLRVRFLLLATRQFADLPAGWTTYGNTTTALTNPTQTAADGETNIRIFETDDTEETGQPSAPFVGNASGIDIIDKDYVTVLGGREYMLGTDNALMFKNVDIYVPINRIHHIISEFGAAPTDQLRSLRSMNLYWTMQIFSNTNANNILAAQDILGTFDIITYFKEV